MGPKTKQPRLIRIRHLVVYLHFLYFFNLQLSLLYTFFNTFRNLHSWHKETLQLGFRGTLGFLGPKVFLSSPNSFHKCFLGFGFFGNFSKFWHIVGISSGHWFFSLQRLAKHEEFQGCVVWDSRFGTFRHCHEVSTSWNLIWPTTFMNLLALTIKYYNNIKQPPVSLPLVEELNNNQCCQLEHHKTTFQFSISKGFLKISGEV